MSLKVRVIGSSSPPACDSAAPTEGRHRGTPDAPGLVVARQLGEALGQPAHAELIAARVTAAARTAGSASSRALPQRATRPAGGACAPSTSTMARRTTGCACGKPVATRAMRCSGSRASARLPPAARRSSAVAADQRRDRGVGVAARLRPGAARRRCGRAPRRPPWRPTSASAAAVHSSASIAVGRPGRRSPDRREPARRDRRREARPCSTPTARASRKRPSARRAAAGNLRPSASSA